MCNHLLQHQQKPIIMTRKVITAKPEFIQAIKAEIAAKKERHNHIYSQIKVQTTHRLKKMNAE